MNQKNSNKFGLHLSQFLFLFLVVSNTGCVTTQKLDELKIDKRYISEPILDVMSELVDWHNANHDNQLSLKVLPASFSISIVSGAVDKSILSQFVEGYTEHRDYFVEDVTLRLNRLSFDEAVNLVLYSYGYEYSIKGSEVEVFRSRPMVYTSLVLPEALLSEEGFAVLEEKLLESYNGQSYFKKSGGCVHVLFYDTINDPTSSVERLTAKIDALASLVERNEI